MRPSSSMSFLIRSWNQLGAWKSSTRVELRRRCAGSTSVSRILRSPFRLGLLALAPAIVWSQGTYTTNFPLTENPISEGGHWINGKTVGLDWTNIRTTPGLAFGTESASSSNLDDSTALLSGTWGPNQTVTAVLHLVPPATQAETEIRLRSSLSAHSCTG